MMHQSAQTRRQFCKAVGLGLVGLAVPGTASAADKTGTAEKPARKPNFIIIFTDDQGYGDLGCYGSTMISTPRIDQMASEGLKFTGFYSQPVCGPARAALLTGCYPTRVMRAGGDLSRWALPSSEVTIAEVLKSVGYATACVGKWDVSGRRFQEGMVPTHQGFDYYFGTLTANDPGFVPLMEGEKEIGKTEDMGSLTKLYTDKAIEYIRENKDSPFFLYLPHTMPHVKLGASEQFLGKSKGGLYGDVIEEIDWNVGRILDTLTECGIDDNTFVIYASDNGPWVCMGTHGGSPGRLRNGKGSAWEGGFRVPCVIRAPGRVPAGRITNQLMTTMDFLPTIAALAGAKPPSDRVIDGVDQSDFVTGKSKKTARDEFFYYVQDNLHAVRKGKWKLALPDRKRFFDYAKDTVPVEKPELYDLEADLYEEHDVAEAHPEVVQELLALAEKARDEIGDYDRIGETSRSREI